MFKTLLSVAIDDFNFSCRVNCLAMYLIGIDFRPQNYDERVLNRTKRRFCISPFSLV